MQNLKSWKRWGCPLGAGLLALALAPAAAQATSYIWTGATSNAWGVSTNWSGGTFPNSASDQATINDPNNDPAQITTSITLGGLTPALTIGDSAGPTALDIASGGTLIMNATTGGISNNKIITIEGTLNTNLGGTTTRHYPIGGTGSLSLLGGTISGSSTRGYWDFNQPVTGYGTLSGRIFDYSTITANNATPITISGAFFTLQGGTLAASGSGSFVNGGTITGFGLISAPVTNNGSISASGGILTITNVIKGGTLAHATEVDLNGATLIGVSVNNATGPVNLTGDSAFGGAFSLGSNGPFNLNGHTMNFVYDPNGAPPTLSIISAITAGTGTINNATSANLDFSQGPYNFAGGSLTSTGGGAFIRGGIYGWGTISAPLIPIGSAAIVSANSSGHTLYVTGPVTMTNSSSNGNLTATSGGILELGAGSILTTTGPSGFTGFVSPGTNGIVNLNGTNIVGGTSPIKLNTGAMNVTGDSTLGGPVDCASTLAINAGKQLSISGGTATVGFSAGSLTNNGTLAVGAGTLNNTLASAYSLGGPGSTTLAGGSISSTGGGGFTSTNTLSGYGAVSAPYTNGGEVIADGNGAEQTLNMQSVTPVTNTGALGWYAQDHGELALPAITVNGAGAYNWGGDPTTFGMVDSVGISFGGSVTPGTLAISLLASDRADVPAGLVNPVGTWKFAPTSLGGTATLTFRYDDAAVAAIPFDASNLQLLENLGSGWVNVPATVDTVNKLITTNAPQNLGQTVFFALSAAAATGACCQPDGSCAVTTQANCTATWEGAGTTCAPNPCPQPNPRLTLEASSGCYAQNDTVTVQIWMRDIADVIVGGQFFLQYDPNTLDFLSATPAPSGFTLEIYEVANEAAGTIDYAVGIVPGASGQSGDAQMATLTFTARAPICSAPGLITWRAHTPATTLTTTSGPETPTLVPLSLGDNQPPTIITPASGTTVECDGTGNTAQLGAWLASHGGASASDNCTSVTWTNDFTALSDGCGATGSALVTFTASDACGNSAPTQATFTIVDTTAPNITPPASTTVQCDGAGNVAALNAWKAGASVFDACDNAAAATYVEESNVAGCGGERVITAHWTATDACGNPATSPSRTFTIDDTTPPVIDVCPSNLTVNADVGTCTALVPFSASAHDTCDPAPSVTYSIDPNTPISNPYTFPTGSTVVTVTATDACGNANSCQFTVTVQPYNDFTATVDLQGQLVNSSQRCLTFTFADCSNGPVVLHKNVTFPAAAGVSTITATFTGLDGVPCSAGAYTCVTVEDELHTLRVRVTPQLDPNNNQYALDVTGANMLLQGDIYHDNVIDILDFGVFISQWGQTPSPNTPCGTTGRHADLNASGAIDTGDYAFISSNFLDAGAAACCSALLRDAPQGRTTISMDEAARLGLPAWVDLNHDGVLDLQDVASLQSGVVPQLPPPDPNPAPVFGHPRTAAGAPAAPATPAEQHNGTGVR